MNPWIGAVPYEVCAHCRLSCKVLNFIVVACACHDYAASSLESIAMGHVMALQHALELVTEHWLFLLPDVI